MLAKSLTALPIVMFAAMFLRLAGVGITWLPSAVSLATCGLAALALKGLAIHRVQFVAAASDWRGLLDRYGFAIGLAALALLAVLIRLPSIGADLGHQPIDIDEHRLASNVKQFFVTGEIGHRTVEHYPGAFFWALTGASLPDVSARVDGGHVLHHPQHAARDLRAGRSPREHLDRGSHGRGRRIDRAPDVPRRRRPDRRRPDSHRPVVGADDDGAAQRRATGAADVRGDSRRAGGELDRPPPVARARRRIRRRGDRHQSTRASSRCFRRWWHR